MPNMSANKVAKNVVDIIDGYWRNEITYEKAKEKIKKIMSDPDMLIKIKRGENYTGVFNNIMGKRRIQEFENFLNQH